MSNRIEVKDLWFHYRPGAEILKGLNLTFDDRSTAIIGQNGAGKSTFVKLLKGLLKPTSGDVLIEGRNTKDTTVAELAKGIGLVFQNPNDQIFKNRVYDEVMFGPTMIGMEQSQAKTMVRDALEEVGLYQLRDENPYDLSLCERKLISIASIIAMDPSIILFDEPTIAQDYAGKERIREIIRRLREKGKLVLAILHDMDFVGEVFERTLVFAKGGILMDGTTEEVFSQPETLRQANLEPPHVTQLCQKLGLQKMFLTVESFVDYEKAHRTVFRF